ncbi:MAG: protoporphyrinogen oxidase, partial [Acidimicrobiia bacterium]|nr:protoporphyrinogen oxidase [Acidimicrobiia bacterium]
MSTRAVVVGGGIAGLSAAFDLRKAGWSVAVHEAADRWGGKILSSAVGDRLVDAGPDTFLARVEPGRQLCSDLGIAHELTNPVAKVPAYLVRSGKLHELPAGSMLGVPTDFDALDSSPLISPEGAARARADLHAPPTPIGDDLSVGELCRDRLGDEVTDTLIDPLLGGINASDIDRLSLRAGAPLLAAAIDRSPSLIEGLRSLRPTSGPTLGTAGDDPVFFGLPEGITRIVDRLVAALTAPNDPSIGPDGGPPAQLLLSNPIRSLAELPPADAVILATPAFVAAELLAETCQPAAERLATIEYASVAQATIELPTEAVGCELDASGILFPRVEGTMITACTWLSAKWAHYRRPDSVLLRLTSGRFGDDRPAQLDDDELTTTLLAELGAVVPITGPPSATRVVRWDRAFPQYTPGHGRRVARIRDAVAADGLEVLLVGAAYDGIGIPACIDGGRKAAA